MKVVDNQRFVLVEGPMDVLAQSQGHADAVPIVVVSHVFAPPEEAGGVGAVGVDPRSHAHVHLLGAAVHLNDRRGHEENVVPDGLDDGSFLYRQSHFSIQSLIQTSLLLASLLSL